MKKIIFVSVLFTLFNSILFAQNKAFEGVILDSQTKNPIVNATVNVVGSNTHALTDKEGKFRIEALEDAMLEIMHMSYQTLTVLASEASTINLSLKKISLDEIIVKSHPLDDISHSVVVIDGAKKGSQARNAAELFNDISGFSIQKRSATASEPSFRAFKYEQMNIKYDGGTKVVHACPNRMDPSTAHVIPEEVSKIEVVKGPFTVRYGQNFGAIVNLVTRTPTPEDYGFHGNVQSGFETNGNNLMVGAQLQYAAEKYDFTVTVEHRDFDDYKDGNGVETPASFVTDSYSIKAGYNPKNNQRLQVDWRQKFGKDIDHAGLPMDSPKDDSYSLGIDYKAQKISELINSLTIKSYLSYVEHLMTNHKRPSFKAMDAQTPVNASTYGGKLELGLTPNANFLLYVGADADLIKRGGERTRIIKLKPDGTPFPVDARPVKKDAVWQDASSSDFGLFTEGTYKLSEKWALTSGVRVDFVHAQIDDPSAGFIEKYVEDVDHVSENTISGNISLKYRNKGTQVQLAYGLGTRSASMIERYIYHFSIGSDSYEYVGNPFLNPEKNNQFEVAFQHKNNKLNVGASVFYSVMKDYISAIVRDDDVRFEAIFKNPFTHAKQYINVDANQVGFDAYFNYKITSHLEFLSDLAYTKATNETYDEPLAQIAPLNAHLGLKFEKKSYWFDLRAQFVAEQDQLSASFKEIVPTPSYITFDIRVGVEPIKNLKLGAAALNIFDEAYYSHLNFSYKNTKDNTVGDWIFEPGRSFSFYAKYTF